MLYLSLFNWPLDRKLTLPLATAVSKVYLLSDASKVLTTKSSDRSVTIDLPPLQRMRLRVW